MPPMTISWALALPATGSATAPASSRARVVLRRNLNMSFSPGCRRPSPPVLVLEEVLRLVLLQPPQLGLAVADVLGHGVRRPARPSRLDLVDDLDVLGISEREAARPRQAKPADANQVEARGGDLVRQAGQFGKLG